MRGTAYQSTPRDWASILCATSGSAKQDAAIAAYLRDKEGQGWRKLPQCPIRHYPF
jgi:hypothetical protein